jgi:hypothetical protein
MTTTRSYSLPRAIALIGLLVVTAIVLVFAPHVASSIPFIIGTSETTTTTLTELVRREAYADGVLYYAEKPGVANFVTRKDISGEATLTGRFPILDKVSAAAIAENSDFTTNSALDTSGTVDVTVSEHAIKYTITRLTLGATVEDMIRPSEAVALRATEVGGVAGRVSAEALQRRQDQDITALFAGFNSSTGSNSGGITSTLFLDARAQLDIDSIPEDKRVAVLHPFQWKSLLPIWDDANTFGAQGAQIVATGAVGTLYGVLIFQTANVATATVSGSTVWAGALMHPDAIALTTKGPMPQYEIESDASLRAMEVVATGVWGEAEYRGGATTSGRGGAGVYLYSNSTVA